MTEFVFYSGNFGTGIDICVLDTERETLSRVGSVAQPRPAHLALSPDNRTLYAASEMTGAPGGVCAYDLANPLAPRRISDVRPGTQGPCYILLTEDGRHLIGCSYFEGDVEVFPVRADGSLGERCAEQRLTVSGARAAAGGGASAQATPRAHGAAQVRGTSFILVTDFSNDRVLCFRLSADGPLSPRSTLSFVQGDEVRHLALHPTRDDVVYMLGQAGNVYTIRVDRESGALTALGGIHALPAGRAYMSSALKCSPDGRHIYVSNRLNRNISVLSIEADAERPVWAGTLENAGYVRDMAFSPDGRYLLVGDQTANAVSLYRMAAAGVRTSSGLAEKVAGVKLLLDSPGCFVFLNPA